MLEYGRLTRRGQIRRMRHLAELALARYAVVPDSLSLLGHLVNTTFAVKASDGSRYMLRIHQGTDYLVHSRRTEHMIESELWWLERLGAKLGMFVPAPVRTPSGETVVGVTGHGVAEPRLCVLFEWMDGRFVDAGLTPTHLERVGRLMARLHLDSARLRVPTGFRRDRVDQADKEVGEGMIRLFRDRWSPESVDVVQGVLERVQGVQDDLGREGAIFGLIHADIHQENYFFSNGAVCLIDFDDCGWGHYLYDLAVTVHNIDMHPRGMALRSALLSGYRQVRDLSTGHEALIDTFYVLRELQMLTWFLQAQEDPSLGDRHDDIAHGLVMMQQFLGSEG